MPLRRTKKLESLIRNNTKQKKKQTKKYGNL